MISNYIQRLQPTSIKAEKIQALEYPIDGLKTYLYYDNYKRLHFLIQSEELIVENRKGIKIINSEVDLINIGKFKFIDIICTHEHFIEEFSKILDQIIELFKSINDISKSIKIILNKWYYFFEKEDTTELTESVIKGLLGELIFINSNVNNFTDQKDLLNCWYGPESGLRDFNFMNFDVEVKTSSKEVGHVHAINGQIQLKSTSATLYIYSISLKKSNSENAITLKKLIDKICLDICNDTFALNTFFEKLEKNNIILTSADKYDKYSYEIKDILTVKITQDNLDQYLLNNSNTRISNMKYDYDFNGIKNSEIIFI
jgi:hypothetical protein